MIASWQVMTSSHCAATQTSLIISTLLAARSLAVNFIDNIAANGNTVVARWYFANITIINITIIVQWGVIDWIRERVGVRANRDIDPADLTRLH